MMNSDAKEVVTKQVKYTLKRGGGEEAKSQKVELMPQILVKIGPAVEIEVDVLNT